MAKSFPYAPMACSGETSACVGLTSPCSTSLIPVPPSLLLKVFYTDDVKEERESDSDNTVNIYIYGGGIEVVVSWQAALRVRQFQAYHSARPFVPCARVCPQPTTQTQLYQSFLYLANSIITIADTL